MDEQDKRTNEQMYKPSINMFRNQMFGKIVVGIRKAKGDLHDLKEI